jgi:hypothetical protein
MIMSKWILAVCLAGLVGGCATSPRALATMSPRGLKTVPTVKLCDAYQFNNQTSLLNEIHERHEFTEEDFALLSTHAMRVGMSEAAARCSWGDNYFVAPGTRHAETQKWVYGLSKAFVFIRAGVVVNYEN